MADEGNLQPKIQQNPAANPSQAPSGPGGSAAPPAAPSSAHCHASRPPAFHAEVHIQPFPVHARVVRLQRYLHRFFHARPVSSCRSSRGMATRLPNFSTSTNRSSAATYPDRGRHLAIVVNARLRQSPIDPSFGLSTQRSFQLFVSPLCFHDLPSSACGWLLCHSRNSKHAAHLVLLAFVGVIRSGLLASTEPPPFDQFEDDVRLALPGVNLSGRMVVEYALNSTPAKRPSPRQHPTG